MKSIEAGPHVISIHESVRGKNEVAAQRNRALFHINGVCAINVMSAPGSGKTALLTRTLQEMADQAQMAVIVGDIATDNDARRLMSTGAKAVQITTNGYCHLDAAMISLSLTDLDLGDLDLLIIENVGNMVCPATFDLGEAVRVVVLSVTEGEDKPLKYPTLFKVADAVLVNKIDLAEAVEFDRETALANIAGVAAGAKVFEVSAKTGTGMQAWYQYLVERIVAAQLATEAKH